MANLFTFGFERLTGAYLGGAAIWDITAVALDVSTTKPRNGGSLQSAIASNNRNVERTIGGGNYSELIGGMAYVAFLASLPATPTSLQFYLSDGTTVQVGWVISSLGEIIVYAGNKTVASATELGRTATGVIVAAGTGGTGADYKMIEMDVVFHGSTGSVVIKVADTEVINLTNKNTAPSGNAYANRIGFTFNGSSTSVHFDDIYLNSTSGSSPDNTFMGEAWVVEGLVDNGNGNSSQWLGSDGNSVDNYLLIDDTGNDDTDYIKSSTLNDIDLHALGNLSNASGTVVATNHYMIAKKDDVATRKIASTIRTNSANFVGADKTMTGSYATYVENRLLNPDTAARFTISEINALEVGEKLTT